MNEVNGLIKTTEQTPIELALGIDEEGYTTSKKLYQFLELDPSHYSRWCNRNIVKNPFAEEGVDYWMASSPPGELTGRGNTRDYKISSSFAKELSATANNSKGRLARTYFRKCEDMLKESVAALRKENDKLKLLTISPKIRFLVMHPKYLILESALGISRKELYKKIFEIMQKDYGIDLTSKTVEYCYSHNLSYCYTMTVIQDDPQLFLCLYEIVDSMLKEIPKTLPLEDFHS